MTSPRLPTTRFVVTALVALLLWTASIDRYPMVVRLLPSLVQADDLGARTRTADSMTPTLSETIQGAATAIDAGTPLATTDPKNSPPGEISRSTPAATVADTKARNAAQPTASNTANQAAPETTDSTTTSVAPTSDSTASHPNETNQSTPAAAVTNTKARSAVQPATSNAPDQATPETTDSATTPGAPASASTRAAATAKTAVGTRSEQPAAPNDAKSQPDTADTVTRATTTTATVAPTAGISAKAVAPASPAVAHDAGPQTATTAKSGAAQAARREPNIGDETGAATTHRNEDGWRLLMDARRAAVLGRLDQAAKHYRALTRQDPQNFTAFGELGNLLYRRQDWHGAGRAYAAAALRLIDLGEARAAWRLLPLLRRLDIASGARVADRLRAIGVMPPRTATPAP